MAALTAALSLLACGQQVWTSPAGAADFGHTKKTYVPPSIIDRRVDFSSLREHQAGEDTDPITKAGPPPAFGNPRPIDVPGGTQSQLNATSTHAHYAAHSSSATLQKVSHANSTTAAKTLHAPGAPRTAPHSVAHASAAATSPPAPPYPNVDLSQASRAVRQRLHNIAASPTTAAEVASLKRQADELVRDGKVNEAKHTLARILQLTPSDKQFIRQVAGVSVERAKQFANSQQFDEAVHYARQALSLDANDADARKVLDSILSKSGENPNDVSVRLKNAELLASQGRNDEAAVEYQEADKLKPTAAGHIGLGNVAVRSNQKQRARNEYMQALEVDPNSASAHRQLGLLKYGAGDIVGANSELSRALILDPHDATSSRTLVELWQHQVSHVPNANSHLGLARAYQLSGDLQSAQTEYRTVVQMDPENPHLPAARQSFKLAMARQEADKDVQAAHTLEQQGALTDAYAKVIEAERLSPGDSGLRVYQGNLLEHLQNPAAARHAYLDALKLNPHQVEAAARLKALPAESHTIMAPGDAGPSALSPGMPGSMSPMLASAMSSQSMPPVPNATPHDPLVQLSNFAYQLRNHMVVQKKTIENTEDAAHDVISHLGDPPASETIHGVGESLATVTDAQTSPGHPDAMGSSVDSALASARAALAAAKGGSLGSSATAGGSGRSSRHSHRSFEPVHSAASLESDGVPAGGGTSAASTDEETHNRMAELQKQNEELKQQLSQLHRPMSKHQKVAASTGAQAPGPTSAQDRPVAPLQSGGTATEPQAVAETPSMVPLADFAQSPIVEMPPLAPPMSTAGQAQSLDAVLNAGGPTQTVHPVTPALSLTPPSAALAETNFNPKPLPLRAPMTAPSGSSAVSQLPAQQQTQAVVGNAPIRGLLAPGAGSLPSGAGGSTPTGTVGSIPAGAAVKLSLESASVKMTGVELIVDLRNDMGSTLRIPEKVHAIIRYSNRKDADVHVSFADTTVPAHGAIRGTIKVPFDKVDPTADLMIPGLLPPGSASRDVHLTTSMALR